MAEETHQQMSEDNSTRLRVVVSALVVIYAMSFLSGFLQDTQYNFHNYIFFSLLFTGGIGLVSMTVKSTQIGTTRGLLFLTGISCCVVRIFCVALFIPLDRSYLVHAFAFAPCVVLVPCVQGKVFARRLAEPNRCPDS